MTALLRPALTLFGVLTALTGLAYPALSAGISQALFHHQAGGSLIVSGDHIVGSELIGQPFSSPGYFWGRPSATAPQPYNGGASTGSNQGPMNPALTETVGARVQAVRSAGAASGVPVDLVTASASGLDPHISPAAAYYQIPRVARARGISEEQLRAVVEAHVEGRWLGVLGEPRVNVLAINLDLDARAAVPSRTNPP